MRRPALAIALLLVLGGCLGEDASPGVTEPAQDGPLIGGLPPDAYEWTNLTTGPRPRTEVVVGAAGGKVYVIGGFEDLGLPVPVPPPTTLVEVYDLAQGIWSGGPAYPIGIHHSVAIEHEGSLYVLGGLAEVFQPTALAFRLDVAEQRWLPIALLPSPRGSHGAALVDGKIYLLGGVTVGGHIADVHVYDVAANSWSTGGRPIPTLRDHTSAAALGGKIYVVGGDVGGHGSNTDANEAFDPATGTWTQQAPLPTVRGSLQVTTWRDRVVAVGGQNANHTFADVEAYDPASNLWVSLPPLQQARHGFGVAVWEENLHAFYGGPEPGLSVTSHSERLAPRV